jgi:hypothetical protein
MAFGLLAITPGVAAADPPGKLYVDGSPGATCSNSGTGTQALPFCTAQAAGPVPGHTTTSFDLTKNIPHFSRWCTGVVLNATATNTTGPGFLTVFQPGSGTTPPDTSNLNWTAGQTVPNLVIADVLNGLNGVAPENFYVSSTTDLVVEVSGYFAASYLA